MTQSKLCPRCRRRLPDHEFNFRDQAHTKLQSYCRACSNLAWRLWYSNARNSAAHRRLMLRRRKQRIARHRQIVTDTKSVPCADCGSNYPPFVMDFDHTADKTGEISRMMYSAGTERLLLEIEKCDVVCANCHRLRTHERSKANQGGTR